MIDLDNEEKEILDAYESGKLSSVADSKVLMARHVDYAATTFKKDARINIRLSSHRNGRSPSNRPTRSIA